MDVEEIESRFELKKENAFARFKEKMQNARNPAQKDALEKEYRASMKKIRDEYASLMSNYIAQKVKSERKSKLKLGFRNRLQLRKDHRKDEQEVRAESEELEAQAKKTALDTQKLVEKYRKINENEHKKILFQTRHRHMLITLAIWKGRLARFKRKYITPITDWLRLKKVILMEKLEPVGEFFAKYWKMVMK